MLRVGIAGFGTVGKLRKIYIDKHSRMKVIAVCDQIYTTSFTHDEGYNCFSDYTQLLDEPLDVLFVCMPNYLAAEITMKALERGLHVFCEKPPGRNVEDITRVIEVEKRCHNQKLMYGFNHRYHLSVRDAMKIVRSKELGDIISLNGIYGKSGIIKFDSDWRTKRALSGGGILLDQGIHMVDMMRLFAGEFTEVHSYISNSYWKHDVEDNAYALMRTQSGVVAFLHSSATQWRHRFQLNITLSKGAICLSGILSGTKSYGAETITTAYAGENDAGDPKEQMIKYNEDVSWNEEIKAFADVILNDKPVCSGSSREALQTMELVYKIYCADEEWKNRFNLTPENSKDVEYA